MGSRRAPRITDADRPSWPLFVSSLCTAYLLASAIDVLQFHRFVDGIVLGVGMSMLVLTFTIAPHRDAYERHLAEAVCDHRRNGDQRP